MSSEEVGRLVRLAETDRTVADPAEDVRGRRMVDSDGEDLGRVEDLLVDDREGRVRFLRIGEGGFLGIGKHHFLIPVEAVVAIDEETVRVSRNREELGGVPPYDPELAEDPAYYGSIYGWWGYPPYWGPGYVGPAYPHV